MSFSQHSLLVTSSIFLLIGIGFTLSRISRRTYTNALSDYAYFLALPAEILVSISGADLGSFAESSTFFFAYGINFRPEFNLA